MTHDVLTHVLPGYLVEIEIAYADEVENIGFVIVPEEQADFSAGFLGETTLLAKAILGEPVGSLVPYFVGDARSVRILSIHSTDMTPANDIAARRHETIRRAVEQSDRTNAMIFASSFSGKWGDYDPQVVDGWNDTQEKSS